MEYSEGEDRQFGGPDNLMNEESCAENISGGVIANGTFYKTGGPRVGESPKGWKENGPGVRWSTTERIGYRGKKGKFTLEIEALDHADLAKGLLLYYEKGEEHPEAVKLDDPEMAGLILSRIINGPPEENTEESEE